jgi:hypothetical protein
MYFEMGWCVVSQKSITNYVVFISFYFVKTSCTIKKRLIGDRPVDFFAFSTSLHAYSTKAFT